jgi:hypothetical protein
MKTLLTVLLILSFGELWSQSADAYVKSIDKLRRKGKLTFKSSTDKTIVGSLTAYYYNGSLVLLSSLTDAETAGTETLYYLRGEELVKVYMMAAQLRSHEDWKRYAGRHKKMQACRSCHRESDCTVTEVTVASDEIAMLERGKSQAVPEEEKAKIIANIRATVEELKAIAKNM